MLAVLTAAAGLVCHPAARLAPRHEMAIRMAEGVAPTGDAPARYEPPDAARLPPQDAALYDPLARGDSAGLDAARIHADADVFFDAVDTDRDGSITLVELRAHLSAVGYAATAAESFFGLIDANADGALSCEELREAFTRYEDPALRLALGLGTSEADAIFASIDANGDGTISSAELEAFVERKGYAPGAAATIFATLDVDSDGEITRDELRNGYVRYAALREALGLGPARGKARRKQPIRWGRGRTKGEDLPSKA